MLFRDHAIETLRTRLSVGNDALEAALSGQDEEQTVQTEQSLDALDSLRDRVTQLETEQGDSFIEDFRSILASNSSNTLQDLGLPNLRDTYYLAKLVNSVATDDWVQEVPDNETQLHVTVYEDNLQYWNSTGKEISVFASQNIAKPEKSIALFKVPLINDDYVSSDDATEIDGFGLSEFSQIKTRIIACLLRFGTDFGGKNLIVCNRRQKSLIKTALDFHIVARGFLISEPQKLSAIFGTDIVAQYIQAARTHSQMGEPLEILSEINGRETILEKFLACYHALENYMLRVKFAKLQNGMSDRTFRIRDLKVLGSVSEQRELNHLKELFSSLWHNQICGEKLINFSSTQLNNLKTSNSFHQNEFEEFLHKLGFVSKRGNLRKLDDDKDLIENIPDLIYQIRCSIVHHKATEFHISSRTLQSETLRLLHVILLIPIMARIAFGLPLVASANPLRYEDRNLRLY